MLGPPRGCMRTLTSYVAQQIDRRHYV